MHGRNEPIEIISGDLKENALVVEMCIQFISSK